jgi:hypothetical protein
MCRARVRVPPSVQLMALAHSERTAGGPSGDTPGAVPAALHSLSTSALADVCAAHGLSVPADSGKDEIVEMLEAHQVTPLDLT